MVPQRGYVWLTGKTEVVISLDSLVQAAKFKHIKLDHLSVFLSSFETSRGEVGVGRVFLGLGPMLFYI